MHTTDHGLRENFFRWNGRLNRKRFIKRTLLLWAAAIIVVFGFLIALVGFFIQTGINPEHMGAAELARLESGVDGTAALIMSPIIISCYMLMIRRLHDVDLSGYFVLLNFIPLANLGLFLYLLVKKGTPAENSYGPDPLGTPVPAGTAENAYASADTSAPADIAPPDANTPQRTGDRS